MSRVLAALALTLSAVVAPEARDGNQVVIEGSVKRGDEFARGFGPGFTFRLRGRDVWQIVITHATSQDRDLIYPVNPPYRFSNRQYVGPGYGDSARDSVRNTPRQLSFLHRPEDAAIAWHDLDRVLWPYGYPPAEVERAASELARLPTGTLTFEILAAELATVPDGPGGDQREVIDGLKFRVVISWPRP